MPCERKRSIKELTALVICSNTEKGTLCSKGWRGRRCAPGWHDSICGIMSSNTGMGYTGLNTGFVKAWSHFALPLNLAANLATGGRAWLQSSQTLEQKQSACTVTTGLCWKWCIPSLFNKLEDVIIVCAFVLHFVFEHSVWKVCITSQKCSVAQSAFNMCQHFKGRTIGQKLQYKTFQFFMSL